VFSIDIVFSSVSDRNHVIIHSVTLVALIASTLSTAVIALSAPRRAATPWRDNRLSVDLGGHQAAMLLRVAESQCPRQDACQHNDDWRNEHFTDLRDKMIFVQLSSADNERIR